MSRKLLSKSKDWAQKMKRAFSNPKSNYKHTPLPNERSFRLLRILGGDQPDVHFTLMSFSLQEPPEYQALSYTWGRAMCAEDSDGTEQFDDPLCIAICNGRKVFITENLNDALLQFRQLAILGYLWVDAICINQKDPPERQFQVSQMGDIYANAKDVIVWLGGDKTDLDNFALAHEKFYPRLCTEFENGRKAGRTLNIRSLELPKHFDMDDEEWIQSWQSYTRFYRTRRWFRRGWVVQEVALAESLVIYCGDMLLEFYTMANLDYIMNESGWLESFGTRINDVDRSSNILDLYHFRVATQKLANCSKNTDSAFNLWIELINKGLDQLRQKDLTLSHDKIYALLGIVNRYIPHGKVSPIRVDYTLPVANLFSKISEFLILELPNLTFLENVNNRPSSINTVIPSWSSDFRRGLDCSCLRRGLSSGYNFSGELQFSLRKPQRQGNCMTFNGRRVDKCISMMADYLTYIETSHLKELFVFCQKLNPGLAKTPHDRFETLWRTMVGNKSFSTTAADTIRFVYPAHERTGDCFIDWVVDIIIFDNKLSALDEDLENKWAKIEQDFKSYPITLPAFQRLIRTLENTSAGIISPVIDQGAEFNELIRNIINGRRVFLTEQGYLGVGADFMQVGDEVWLLETGDVGYILRPVPGEETYTFVSEAYLHGFMNGEALDIPGCRDGIGPVHVV